MMKNNYHWILLGIALGILIYILDKYLFSNKVRMKKLNLNSSIVGLCSTLTILAGAITAAYIILVLLYFDWK